MGVKRKKRVFTVTHKLHMWAKIRIAAAQAQLTMSV